MYLNYYKLIMSVLAFNDRCIRVVVGSVRRVWRTYTHARCVRDFSYCTGDTIQCSSS